jgi:membrane protease YdiL (CAAX protease family)
VLAAAGVLYARSKNIPGWAAFPLLAAFLVEYPFYLVLAFPTLRERLGGVNLPVYVLVTALLPYAFVCLGPVRFDWEGLVHLLALASAIGLWNLVLPPRPVFDLGFLVLVPSVLLGGYFETIFRPVYPFRGELAFLGHFILIQTSIVVLMQGRRVKDVGFGFVPTWREWRIGALNYFYFVIVAFPLALALQAVRWGPGRPVWTIAGTFVGYLWVVALSEEFFFRGILLDWIEDWTRSRNVALAVTSVAFGLVHLWFRGFPNWRWVIVAGLLGWACGRARLQAGGIRAGVVTHSLVVATWRAFFA